MKKVVEREKNKIYYRVLHLPIWLWVFFVLPGHLTYALYLHGPDRRHGVWLGLVFAVCTWRGLAGRLPGEDKPNLPYRVVCYTSAWIALIVPFVLNLFGLLYASASGQWIFDGLWRWLYYPLALSVAAATCLDRTPRACRSTINEGAEKAWFYLAIWYVVPAQVAAWGAWRLGGRLGLSVLPLARFRLAAFLLVAGIFFLLGLKAKLPRTRRYHYVAGEVAPATGGM
jgi:hypothetical protein